MIVTKEDLINLISKFPDGFLFGDLGTDLNDEERHKIYIYPPTIKPIAWSTEDFKWAATTFGSDENWEEVYDESKFEYALQRMIEKHEAEFGITWDTIDFYLDKYCRKEVKNEV